jgi:hypothetical protein
MCALHGQESMRKPGVGRAELPKRHCSPTQAKRLHATRCRIRGTATVFKPVPHGPAPQPRPRRRGLLYRGPPETCPRLCPAKRSSVIMSGDDKPRNQVFLDMWAPTTDFA